MGQEETERNANFCKPWVFTSLTSICAKMSKIVPAREKNVWCGGKGTPVHMDPDAMM